MAANIYFSLSDFFKDFNKKDYSSIFLICDKNTAEFCLPRFRLFFSEANIYTMPAGEEKKSLQEAANLWDWLISNGADRKSLVFNLGGGVVCDMGSFVASTCKRGIAHINIPTSLLAMADAAIGGKTGINLGPCKNQVGTFAEAKAIVAEPAFLKTLPERELISGYAEILKHALIADRALWEELRHSNPMQVQKLQSLIERAIGIKQQIVAEDPQEQNVRKKLNFGHTVGHAIESLSLQKDKNPLTHGEAVGMGMIAEAWLSMKKSGLKETELEMITKGLLALYPPRQIKPKEMDLLLQFISADKKNVYNSTRFSLLTNIGNCVTDVECSVAEITDAINYMNTEAK